MFALCEPTDGGVPSYRAIDDEADALPGEVVVTEIIPGGVWDAGLGALREPTPAEALVPRQREKLADLHQAGLDELSPLFTEGAGENELVFLLAGHVLKLYEILKATPDPRLAEVVSTGQKALAKKAEVEAAKTPDELEAVRW